MNLPTTAIANKEGTKIVTYVKNYDNDTYKLEDINSYVNTPLLGDEYEVENDLENLIEEGILEGTKQDYCLLDWQSRKCFHFPIWEEVTKG